LASSAVGRKPNSYEGLKYSDELSAEKVSDRETPKQDHLREWKK
jgi:hypothetical protein